MKRFGLAFIGLLVAGLLAVGALSALADKGGPGHGAEHGVANGLQDGDGVVAQQDGDDNAEGPREVKGIPDKSGDVGALGNGDGPNGLPFNPDGVNVRETPGGVSVRVPNQAADAAAFAGVGATGEDQGAGQGHAFGRGHGTGQPEGVPAGEEE